MTELQGVDVSFDVLSDEKARRLTDAGVRVFAQALWTGQSQPPPRVGNLLIARNHGMVPVGYISLTGAAGGAWHVEQARSGVPDDLWASLALTPIDVELDGIPNIYVRDAVEHTVALGKRRSIYTSPNAWRTNQGDSPEFGDCLLWLAQWDADPDPAAVSLPGVWTMDQLVAKQYTGGGDVDGTFADRDTWIEELLMDAPTKQEFQNLFGYTAQLGKTTTALATAFADHVQHTMDAGDWSKLDVLQHEVDALAAAQAAAAKALAPP